MSSSNIWSSVSILALLLALTAYSWRRRRLPAAPQFALASLFAILWVASAVGEYASTTLDWRVFWYKMQVAWQLPSIVGIASFVLEYAWPGRWLSRRNLTLLYSAAVVMLLLILTNDSHHWLWVSLTADGAVAPVRGPANWILVIYALALGLIQIGTLVWLFVRSPAHRLPAAIMVTGVLGNRVAYILKATGHRYATYLPSEVTLVGFAALIFGTALFGFRILNPIAQAHLTAVTQMSDGMVVVDIDGNVANLNPAAQAILGVSAKRAVGRPVDRVLPAECLADGGLGQMGAGTADCLIGAGHDARQVAVVASDLKDWRGARSGRLILLRDITVERRAQAKILEQQRSLATLTERERLARELHDSLGQTLAAAHLQASTARTLLGQDRLGDVDMCLGQIAEMTLAAEVDVREYILGARTFQAGAGAFFGALRQYVSRFGQRYGLRAELNVAPELERRGLGQATETQLLRIIQEALSNIRKHAGAAGCVVELAAIGPNLVTTITDDGHGFDAQAVAARAASGEGFGLQTMRERAGSLGGFLAVESRRGHGTRITVTVPLAEVASDA